MAANNRLIWGGLLHLGMNMWCDWENPKPLSYGWEETVIRDLKGNLLETLPGDVRIMPNGEMWYLK